MKKMLSVALAATLGFSVLVGCAKNEKPGGNTPGGEGVYVPTAQEENTPMVFGIDGADGVFSPFFSSAQYDSEIVGMTQLGMLTVSSEGKPVCGDDLPSVAKDHKVTYLDSGNREINKPDGAAFTRYDFLIKKGIKFSDGIELTIKDVLFNLYVYLDPVYTGNATIYSTDIVGLSEYRTQTPDENANEALEEASVRNAEIRLLRICDWLRNQALLEDTPNGKYEELTEQQIQNFVGSYDNHVKYAEEVKKDVNFFLPLYKQELEVDFKSAMSSFDEERKNVCAFDEGEYWQSFMYMYGFLPVKQDVMGTPIKDAKGRYTFDWEDSGNAFLKTEIAEYDAENWQKMHGESDLEKHNNAKMEWAVNYVYSANASVLENGEIDYANVAEGLATTIAASGSTNTLLIEIQADEKSKLIKQNAGDNAVRSVSGITSAKVNEFNGKKLDGEYDVLSIKINKVDPKAIWNFAFTVSPMHYYSYKGAGDEGEYNVNNNFGVRFNDTSFMNDVLKEREKLGVPVGAGPYKASKSGGLDANQEYPSKNDFNKDNRIYYERNTYYDTVDGVVGGKIQNAKIKYLQYKIVNTNFLLDSLTRKEIDMGLPSATAANIDRINGISHLASRTTRTNGYGYIGINAAEIPDVWMRRAIIKAMDTKTISEGYYNGGLCELIFRPMSKESWAYPDTDAARRPYSFVDEYGTTVDYIFDAEGTEIANMLKENGYSVSGGKVLKDPDGNPLPKITFTVAGESNDHPAWQMFKKAEEVLERIGFEIDVKTDAFALTKLSKGELAVWAAAWSSTIDPDMYQVYHKDSTATSTLNWGYRAIKADKQKYAYEWNVIEKLSTLIDQGRTFIDDAPRKQIYAKALDLIMELAVEMPTYQRNDLTVYNKDKIDAKTLNQSSSSFEGLFSRVWEIGYTK